MDIYFTFSLQIIWITTYDSKNEQNPFEATEFEVEEDYEPFQQLDFFFYKYVNVHSISTK